MSLCKIRINFYSLSSWISTPFTLRIKTVFRFTAFRLRGKKVEKVLLERLHVKLLWRPDRVEYLSVEIRTEVTRHAALVDKLSHRGCGRSGWCGCTNPLIRVSGTGAMRSGDVKRPLGRTSAEERPGHTRDCR